jgi:putative ABC transport system permease protein
VFTPQQLDPNRRGARNLFVLARIKPDTTLERAEADTSRIASQLQEEHQRFYAPNSGYRVSLIPLHDIVVGDIHSTLLLLLGAVGIVLLIACTNVANLILSRMAGRQREIGIRMALGAKRLRLVRQFMTESLVVSLLGAGLGVFLAYWGVGLIKGVAPQDTIPRAGEVGVDGSVLLFTLSVSVLAAIIFGLAPALQASKPGVTTVLREGERGSTADRNKLRSGLVIAEVACAFLLLVAAGLVIKSFWNLQTAEMGFDPSEALTMRTYVPQLVSRYREPRQQAAFFTETLQRISNLAGVEHLGATNHIPLHASSLTCSFSPEGKVFAEGEAMPEADWRIVSPGFFDALGIQLRKGRYFNEFDNQGVPAVAIVDELMESRYWPNEDAVGKRIKLTLPALRDVWVPIVGVVGHIWNSRMNAAVRPQVYLSYLQSPTLSMTYIVRSKLDWRALAPSIAREIHSVDSEVPVYDVKSMTQVVSEANGNQRLLMVLLSLFAGLALVLALIGVYGVVSYSVSQRTHEIGIRMALGARAGDVRRLVVTRGMLLIGLGIVVGLVLAFSLTRVATGILYGTSALNPAVFALIPVLLVFAGLVACLIPAYRATKVDPMVTLRYE